VDRDAAKSAEQQGNQVGRFKLHARPYFAGILLGFGACVFAGHELSRTTQFDNYVRMFIPIQPQMQYYPSPFQLVNTVSKLYVPGTTLVIVGGSSIFRGTGQNASHLWSNRLQADLGSGYTVVNLSIDQQSMESFAAVLFRILRQRYEHVIYVGLADERGAGPIDGLPVYKYFFWDAYYSGLLGLSGRDLPAARALRASELNTRQGDELQIGSWLESKLRFRVLWNEVGYRFYFPIWTVNAASDPFLARDQYIDVIDPNLTEIQRRTREDQERHDLMKDRFSDLVDAFMDRGQPSKLQGPIAANIRQSYDSAFPKDMRSQILAVFLQPNPEYTDLLPAQKRDALKDLAVRTSKIVRDLGYRSIVVEKSLVPDDYFDQGHLMASGGHKLADEVAEEVRAMTAP
jgi:hypothetical protein